MPRGRHRALFRRAPCPKCGRITAYSGDPMADARWRSFRDHNDPATGKPCRHWEARNGTAQVDTER